jgi:hypothetical protein
MKVCSPKRKCQQHQVRHNHRLPPRRKFQPDYPVRPSQNDFGGGSFLRPVREELASTTRLNPFYVAADVSRL